MATSAELEGSLRSAREALSQYTQTSPSALKNEIDAAWSPILDKAAGEVARNKQEFIPRYFEGMMNTGYGMGTSEADLSPTQKLSNMGSMLGQFSGDIGRSQAVVDYLGGSLNNQYNNALAALQWKAQQAQQGYQNLFGEYSLAKQLEDAAAARAAAARAAEQQSNWMKEVLATLNGGQAAPVATAPAWTADDANNKALLTETYNAAKPQFNAAAFDYQNKQAAQDAWGKGDILGAWTKGVESIWNRLRNGY